MVFYKQKKQGFIDFRSKPTIESNIYDAPKTHIRHFYGIIDIDGVSNLFDYDSILRSEALSYFKRLAKKEDGEFKLMSTYNN